MKSFFKNLGQGANGKDPNSLIGKCIQCSQFNLMCEDTIGAGGYASIYRVRDTPTGQTYALKHLRLPQDSDAVADVRHEMRVMHLLGNHPNVLKLYAASFAGPAGKETDAFMVMDYCPITLLDMMQRSNFQLDEFFVHEVFSEVCHAVAHMHTFSPPYAHRDIKAENVLKTSKGKWVLCDFGSATSKGQVFETPAEIAMEEDVIRRTTTPAYRAPEMWDLMSRQRIDTKVDIWALGVLLYVLVFGKLPFQGDSKLSVLFGKVKGGRKGERKGYRKWGHSLCKYEMPPGKHPLMCDLIRDMLTTDPALRPDVMTVISRLDVIKQSLLQSIPGAPPAVAPPAPTGIVITTSAIPTIPVGPLQQASATRAAAPPSHQAAPTLTSINLHRTSAPLTQLPAATSAPHPGSTSRHSPATPAPPAHTNKASSIVWQPQNPPAPVSLPGMPTPATTPSPPLIPGHNTHNVQSHPVSVHNTPGNNPNSIHTRHAAQVAAATPLFVPSEGALQLNATSFTQPSSSSAQPPQLAPPPQPPQPQTTTLIDVDAGPAPSDAKASLLGDGFSPVKKHGGHKHHRSSSFNKDIALTLSAGPGHTAPGAAGGSTSGFASGFGAAAGTSAAASTATATFDPDWGDQPAFGGGASQSITTATSSQAQVRATSTSTLAPGGMHKSGHAHHMSQQQGSNHQTPIVSRLSENGVGGGATPSSPAMLRRSPAASRSQSHTVEAASELSVSAPASQGMVTTSTPHGTQNELDMLKVQVKGLLSTQSSLLTRVKQLEDLTLEQAALIRALQQDIRGSGTAGDQSY